MKEIMQGNAAIARGAWEAGVKVAAAYPGTPSSEILKDVADNYPEIYAEWSPNEMVAVQVAAGAALAGARAMASMKHVGMNVAADALMTLAYTGIKGGHDRSRRRSQRPQLTERAGQPQLGPLRQGPDAGTGRCAGML